MADDTTLNPGGGGDTIRDVDKNPGVVGKTQVVIIDMGGGGAENLAATPATQATLAALLAELLLKAKLTDTQPVSAASLPLPTGAALEAGNLATIAAKDFATQATLALVSTAAKQDTGNASLASIDGKLTNPLPVNGTVTGNQGTPAATANAWPVKVTDGSNVQAVKAAATAALAADPSSVVALSPNTPLPAGTNALGSVSVSASVLSALIGTLEARPAAYSLLDREYQNGLKLDALKASVATEATLKNVLAALSKPVSRPYTTLLHRN